MASSRRSDEGSQGVPSYDLIVSEVASHVLVSGVQVMCWAGPAGMLTGPHPVPGDVIAMVRGQRKHVVWRLSAGEAQSGGDEVLLCISTESAGRGRGRAAVGACRQ
ncbi:hypothetical protein PMIN01_06668 [Paraphaeosphaeria minitans]|uniref:Uncharacterized protein n=1 Tax=Paraphaeosphaeria minitans TaxID=565426 RepID=A0A9P6KQ07_9PLEO|nr:hypothetical protein PMIN01_06668 [Paraphaeosphaeria minitans]